MSAFLDSSSKVTTVYLTLAKEIDLFIRVMDIGAQKIDSTTLDSNRMIVAAFLVTDKANRVRFFEKTFLVANVSSKVVLEMLFFILSDANIDFLDRKFR